MHPRTAVPLMRGEIGGHVAATKERILFYTAPRVQPHEGLPAGYALPPFTLRWKWVLLDAKMATVCGMRELLRDPA
eukprot:3735167-Heterocapsa_arctica.AAC.1